MINQVTKDNLLNSISQTFNVCFNTNETYNLTINQVPNMADGSSAGVLSPIPYSSGGIDLTMVFNESIMSAASKEYIAETIFHEILHTNLTVSTDIKGKMQHLEIARNYIDQERIALQEIFPNLINCDAYAMIISGLGEIITDFGSLGTDYFNSIVASYAPCGIDMNTIINTTAAYKTGITGTPCSTTQIK